MIARVVIINNIEISGIIYSKNIFWDIISWFWIRPDYIIYTKSYYSGILKKGYINRTIFGYFVWKTARSCNKIIRIYCNI
jgi:hypothetical protein